MNRSCLWQWSVIITRRGLLRRRLSASGSFSSFFFLASTGRRLAHVRVKRVDGRGVLDLFFLRRLVSSGATRTAARHGLGPDMRLR